MKIGVNAHDYGKMNPEHLAKTLSEHGYECAQLVLPKAIAGIDNYESITPSHLDEIEGAFSRRNIEITVLGCYMDLSNPDIEVRNIAVATLKKYLAYSKTIGAKMVGTQSALGSAAKRTHYGYMIDSLLRVIDEAVKLNVKLAIEPVYYHPLNCLDTVIDVMKDVNDAAHLRMIFNASNILTFPLSTNQDNYWPSWLRHVGEYVDVMKISDFTMGPNGNRIPTPLGDGIINYVPISRWIHNNKPYIPLLREDMNFATAQSDITFMRNL